VIDARVLELAARQYGVVGRQQLADLGVSRSAAYRARRAGLLIEVTRSVMRVASSPVTFEMRCMAAQMHTHSAGFLGGVTAGRLRGLRAMPTRTIHVTITEASRASRLEWIRLHYSSWFDGEADREVRADSLIVATPLRMLFGLAAELDQYRFERAAEDAWHQGLLTPAHAADYLERHRCRGKTGVSTMERWLEHACNQRGPAESGLEQDLLEAFESVGLARPERQYPLALPNGESIRLDIAWPDIKLAVEPGASWWHGGDLGQRKDHERDRACGELGWQIVRFDESLRDSPMAAARQVRRIHHERRRLFASLDRSPPASLPFS
jgi:very-short-patch-repair endonuclease